MKTSTIGARIKARRQELKMTQRELAARLGYTDHTTVTRIESGKTDPPQSRLAQIAKVLDVTPGYLMGWSEKPAEELQDMGAMAAQVLADPDVLEMVKAYTAMDETDRAAIRNYMNLNDVDRYAVQLVMASMGQKQKKTDAGASVVKTKKSLKKADCDI